MCGEAIYLFGDLTGTVFPVCLGQMRSKGHCTYLSGRNTILNDTVRITGRILAVTFRRWGSSVAWVQGSGGRWQA